MHTDTTDEALQGESDMSTVTKSKGTALASIVHYNPWDKTLST